MLPHATSSFLLTTILIATSPSYVMAKENNPLTLSLEVGAEYDNNITVDALDVTSQLGDEAILFDGLIEYDFVNKGDTSFTAGYSFSQSLYLDFTEFDLQIHGASLAASTKVKDVDLGIAYRYSNISLGREAFLQMHSIQPTFTTLIGSKFLLMGGYEYLKQNFQQPLQLRRSADRHSINIKNYFLLGKGRTINIGYKLSRNNAVASELTYWSHTFDVGLKLPVGIIEGAKFRARYRYQQKDYSNIDPTIGENRADKRHSIRASMEVPIIQNITAKLQYEYTDSNSNLPVLVYNSHLITFKLGWEL